MKKERQRDIQATYFLILFLTRTSNEGKEVEIERESERERVRDIVSQTHTPNRFLILLLLFVLS